ncbi:MAG: hypothetical protein ACMUJM_22815 [bacterium]
MQCFSVRAQFTHNGINRILPLYLLQEWSTVGSVGRPSSSASGVSSSSMLVTSPSLTGRFTALVLKLPDERGSAEGSPELLH